MAIPASFRGRSGFVGYLLEVGLIRFLYGRPLDTLLATWGVEHDPAAGRPAGVRGRPASRCTCPRSLDGHWQVGGVTVPHYRVFIVGVTALCLLAVYLLVLPDLVRAEGPGRDAEPADGRRPWASRPAGWTR